MLVEIRTVQDYNLYVNLTNVTTVRVVPVNNRKFAIAMDILPGKTILVKVLGENYYDTREEADGIAAEFVEVFNEVSTKGQANVDDSLCWFGVCDGFDSGSEEPDCEPEEGEDDDEVEPEEPEDDEEPEEDEDEEEVEPEEGED